MVVVRLGSSSSFGEKQGCAVARIVEPRPLPMTQRCALLRDNNQGLDTAFDDIRRRASRVAAGHHMSDLPCRILFYEAFYATKANPPLHPSSIHS